MLHTSLVYSPPNTCCGVFRGPEYMQLDHCCNLSNVSQFPRFAKSNCALLQLIFFPSRIQRQHSSSPLASPLRLSWHLPDISLLCFTRSWIQELCTPDANSDRLSIDKLTLPSHDKVVNRFAAVSNIKSSRHCYA